MTARLPLRLVSAACACLPCLALAQDAWPEFRGPSGDGQAASRNLPLRWSESANVRWKVSVPGQGWSTPVIWQQQLWLTTATPDGRRLFALGFDKNSGRLLHEVLVFEVTHPQPKNSLNSYASPSPCIEDGRVYVHFGTYGTACINTDSGAVVWRRDDMKLDHKEGPGSSPILFDDLLIVHLDGMDVQYVAALHKDTGKTVWKTDRSADLSSVLNDYRKAYCTPLVVLVDGRPRLISPGAKAAYGYDPLTGRELFRIKYEGFSNVARPLVGHGLMFLNTGFVKPDLLAVRLGASGELSTADVVWHYSRSVPCKPSPVLVGDWLLMINDQGVATCLEAPTGKPLWTQRIPGNYSASPIASGRRVFFCNEEGRCTVVQAEREYRELAVNTLDDGCMASPAASGNALFLRTKSHLYRIEDLAGGE